MNRRERERPFGLLVGAAAHGDAPRVAELLRGGHAETARLLRTAGPSGG